MDLIKIAKTDIEYTDHVVNVVPEDEESDHFEEFGMHRLDCTVSGFLIQWHDPQSPTGLMYLFVEGTPKITNISNGTTIRLWIDKYFCRGIGRVVDGELIEVYRYTPPLLKPTIH